MHTRHVVLGLLLTGAIATPAQAQQSVPLPKAQGENIAGVARVPFPGANEVELAGDWAFVSVDKGATGNADGGLVIVNIADPEHPYVESSWYGKADSNISDVLPGDVDLSPDSNLAVLTNAHCNTCANWVFLIDTSDKAHPHLVGKIKDDATMDYVHTSTMDNKLLYLNPQVAAFYPQPQHAQITIFDISNPANPVKKGTVAPPAADVGLAHDNYIDHRPDGKTLMYAASVHKSDVIDITNPFASTWLQTTTSPNYTISHDVQPNFDRSIIVVDDEGAAGGQLDNRVSACGKVGAGPASVDSGSVHFFMAAADGTFQANGAARLGSFNAPANVNTKECVAHVFWQAPNENRLTQAYYRTGAFVLDFNPIASAGGLPGPIEPKMLGWFLPVGGAMYWSNKPHNGYMFASDMLHGLDVLKYTGEGGTRWPATAGPAEKQRSARQGVPYVPIATPGA
jgi:hypothetical protein